MKNQLLISLTFIICLFITRPVYAQTIELGMIPDSISTIEIDHTRILVSDGEQSFLSGNNNFQYKHVLNSKFNLIGKVSYFHQKIFSDAENGFSNVFLGAQYKTSKSDNINSALNFGVYLPTAELEAQSAIFYNTFDFSKYTYKRTTIQLGYSSFFHYNSGLRLGFEVGSDVIFPVGDNNSDTDVYGRYGISIMYKTTSGLYFQSELLGIAFITNEGDGFDDSTLHTYSLGAGYNGSKVGAGIYYRNYFDELFGDNVKGILGIEFNIFL